MRISYRTVKEFINKELPAKDLIDMLIMLGLEVEEVQDLGALCGKIVIGKILSITPHPQAERLVVCKVDTGAAKPASIVCGAKNMKEKDKVVVALPESKLPCGTEIKRSVIRGVASEGMLCSGVELLWSEDKSGIVILPEELPVGEPFDALMEVKVTPNRPDCLSIMGVGRELSAKLGSRVFPPAPRFSEATETIESVARVSIEARKGCPRYTARVIRGVRIGESPRWVKHFLEAGGLRPINNVVDATNYVLLELGHPLHPFDLDKIAAHHVVVRYARQGEPLITLDDETCTLSSEDVVIADEQRAIALAGIMGGRDTEISQATVNVLLECAYFDPVTIRRTSRRLGKQTEASYRFERGMDREGLLLALNRATELIKEIAGGQVARGVIDVHYPVARSEPITLSFEHVSRLLGTEVSGRDVANILGNLGFEITRSSREGLVVSAPSFRVDVTRDVDLIEEVARHYGYEKIPSALPSIAVRPTARDLEEEMEDLLKRELVGAGFQEVVTYSFVGKDSNVLYEPEGEGNTVEVMNPLSQEQAVMRSSILPGLIQTFRHNLNYGVSNIRIFELGCGYRWQKEKKATEEYPLLCMGMAGNLLEGWQWKELAADFFTLKGVVANLLEALGIEYYELERSKALEFLHPYRQAQLICQREAIGWLGELSPLLIEKLELRGRIWLANLELDQVIRHYEPVKGYQELKRFPAVDRDLAIVVDEEVVAGNVEMVIRETAKDLLEELKLFDVYYGKPIPEGKKSLAYHLRFRSGVKTLREEEVAKLMEKTLAKLQKQLGAELR